MQFTNLTGSIFDLRQIPRDFPDVINERILVPDRPSVPIRILGGWKKSSIAVASRKDSGLETSSTALAAASPRWLWMIGQMMFSQEPGRMVER